MPCVASSSAVMAPTHAIISKNWSTMMPAAARAKNSGPMRATKNTPAFTMVAACISAETAVGPVIASRSHSLSGNCADLPTAPPKSSTAAGTSRPSACMAEAHAVSAPSSRNPKRARVGEYQKHAGQHHHVAHLGHDERLHARVRGRIVRGQPQGRVPLGAHVVLLFVAVPEADQHVRGQPHALPAEEHLQQVVGEHDQLHRADEEHHPEPEPRQGRIAAHVAGPVYHDEQRYPADHVGHDDGQRIRKDAGPHADRLYPGYLIVDLGAAEGPGQQQRRRKGACQREADRHVAGPPMREFPDGRHYQGRDERQYPDRPGGLGAHGERELEWLGHARHPAPRSCTALCRPKICPDICQARP